MTEDYLVGKGKQQVEVSCGQSELYLHEELRKPKLLERGYKGECGVRSGWELSMGQPLAGSNDNNNHKYDSSHHILITCYMPDTVLGMLQYLI